MVAGAQNPPIKELDEIPSPYLTGLFDELLRDIKITPLMQFVRGCPFKCIFCQKELTGRGFRVRSTEMIVDELEHLVKVYDPGVILFVRDRYRDEWFADSTSGS